MTNVPDLEPERVYPGRGRCSRDVGVTGVEAETGWQGRAADELVDDSVGRAASLAIDVERVRLANLRAGMTDLQLRARRTRLVLVAQRLCGGCPAARNCTTDDSKQQIDERNA